MSGGEPSSERCRWAEEEEAAALARGENGALRTATAIHLRAVRLFSRTARADKYRFGCGALAVKRTQFSGAS